MNKQKGFSLPESIAIAALITIALSVPIDDSGIPDSNGKPAFSILVESFRANFAAWAFAMSLPDA